MARIPRQQIDAKQARFYAETLDKMECDLVRFQHQLFRIRKALQGIVGETVGYQYDEQQASLGGAMEPAAATTASEAQK